MNAAEHAEMAAGLAESAQANHDDDARTLGLEQAQLAQAHALTSIALSLQTDHALLAELAPSQGEPHG